MMEDLARHLFHRVIFNLSAAINSQRINGQSALFQIHLALVALEMQSSVSVRVAVHKQTICCVV